MAKKKAAKKSKSKKGTVKKGKAKKAAAAKRGPMSVEERIDTKPSALAASLIVTTCKDDATIAAAVLKKFPDAPPSYRADAKYKSVAFIRNDIQTGLSRFDWVKTLKGYKAPKPKAKVKAKAKRKVTAKKK